LLLVVLPFPDQLQLPLTGMSSEQLEHLCQKDKIGTTDTKIGKDNENSTHIKQFVREQMIAESPL